MVKGELTGVLRVEERADIGRVKIIQTQRMANRTFRGEHKIDLMLNMKKSPLKEEM